MIRKEGTFLPFFRNKKREEEKSRKFESGSEKKKFKRQSCCVRIALDKRGKICYDIISR